MEIPQEHEGSWQEEGQEEGKEERRETEWESFVVLAYRGGGCKATKCISRKTNIFKSEKGSEYFSRNIMIAIKLKYNFTILKIFLMTHDCCYASSVCSGHSGNQRSLGKNMFFSFL